MRFRFLLLAIPTLAGCTGGGSGVHGRDLEGYVRLERIHGSLPAVRGRAAFPDAATLPPRGSCARDAAVQAEYLDAGEVVLLRGSSDTIALDARELGGLRVYGVDGLAPSRAEPGAEFDVEIPGSALVDARVWERGIEIPPPLEVGDIDWDTGLSLPLDLVWTPSGADDVIVELGGPLRILCRFADEGDGRIPGALNDLLDTGPGVAVFHTVRRRVESLAGRRVALEGRSSVSVSWE